MIVPPCAHESPMRAAGIPPNITVADPFKIVSGGPTHVHIPPTTAAGIPPINTVGTPGGRIGPPTCGTTPVTIGHTCISPALAAGGMMQEYRLPPLQRCTPPRAQRVHTQTKCVLFAQPERTSKVPPTPSLSTSPAKRRPVSKRDSHTRHTVPITCPSAPHTHHQKFIATTPIQTASKPFSQPPSESPATPGVRSAPPKLHPPTPGLSAGSAKRSPGSHAAVASTSQNVQ